MVSDTARAPDHTARGLDPTLARALDHALELAGRRRLEAADLRVLLALLDRDESLSELAESLHLPPAEIRCAGRSLAMHGLVRWLHPGPRHETRLEITPGGLTTVEALLTPRDASAERQRSSDGGTTSTGSFEWWTTP